MALTKEQFVELTLAIAAHAMAEAKKVKATRNELGAALTSVLDSYADACAMELMLQNIDNIVCQSLAKNDRVGHS